MPTLLYFYFNNILDAGFFFYRIPELLLAVKVLSTSFTCDFCLYIKTKHGQGHRVNLNCPLHERIPLVSGEGEQDVNCELNKENKIKQGNRP